MFLKELTLLAQCSFRKKGGDRKVLLYASIILDPVETKAAPCIKYASALAKLVEKTAHVVPGHPLTILTSHSTVAFVTSAAFLVTSTRQTRILNVLTQPHIIYTHDGINVVDAMVDGEPH